jgi:drug/metabolite transporter (DMT)-like permease
MTTHEKYLPSPTDTPVYLKLAAVTMIWGGTFVAGRFLAESLSPLFAASLRFLLASTSLLLFLLMSRIPLARPSQGNGCSWRCWALRDLFLQPVLLLWPALHQCFASLVDRGLEPGRYRIGLWLLFKERLGRTKIAGIAICIVGACLVIVSRHPQLLAGKADAWIGDLLIFGCVLGWGVYSLFSRR